MHKKIKPIYLIIIFSFLLITPSYYYFIFFPKDLARQTHKALELDKPIYDSFFSGSRFQESLENANISEIIFRTKENEVCTKIERTDLESYAFGKKIAANCYKLCLDINPSYYIHGSFCAMINELGVIVSKEDLYFWSNF